MLLLNVIAAAFPIWSPFFDPDFFYIPFLYPLRKQWYIIARAGVYIIARAGVYIIARAGVYLITPSACINPRFPASAESRNRPIFYIFKKSFFEKHLICGKK